MRAVRVEEATVGGPTTLLGRPSSSREGWETARAADAEDLNRLLEAGGEIEAYVAPLWSNGDVARCLSELRGFDDARVYVEIVLDEGAEEALAHLAESEWAGVAYLGDDRSSIAFLIHTVAALDIPLYIEAPNALKALALALGEDLSPREIEATLKGEGKGEPDVDALNHARELLAP